MRRTDIGPRSPSAGALVVNPAGPGGYQTIQAALNAGAAGSATSYVVEYKPGTYTENLTVAPGKDVTLRCAGEDFYKNVISGAITWNGAADDSLSLVNTYVTGTVGGAATGECYLMCSRAAIDGAVTFTGSAVHIYSDGKGGFNDAFQGYFGAAVATTGGIVGISTGIFGALTAATIGIFLNNSRMQGTFALTTAGTDIRLSACDRTSGAQTFVFSGSAGIITADQYSLAQIQAGSTAAPTNGAVSSRLSLGTASTLTLATDIITIKGGVHAVDTEAAAASDNLATINGGLPNQLLVLYAADSARTVVAKDGTGNLKLSGGDFSMDNAEDRLLLISDALGTTWYELGRNDSGA